MTSDGTTTDQFGYSVVTSGDVIVIGASTDDIGGNSDQGSAYVFTKNATNHGTNSKNLPYLKVI